MAKLPPILNMPAGVNFLPALAAGLDAHFGDDLNEALILLPTRRAVRNLSEAFTLLARSKDQRARLLPPMRTLADIDPDQPPFEPGDLAARVRPAISGLDRRLELSLLVRRYYENISGETLAPSIALGLTEPLLRILDDVAMEGMGDVDLSGLEEISERAAQHYKLAGKFYEIIKNFWTEHLDKLNLIEPMARRVKLLGELTDQWTSNPPDHPVIIAGSTGTLPATAKLMRCVQGLPQGHIILPGLTTDMRSEAWNKIGPDHPQYSMRLLLQRLKVSFDEVPNFVEAVDLADTVKSEFKLSNNLRARHQIISESLVPVDATQEWLARIDAIQTDFEDGKAFEMAAEGLSLIEAEDEEEEALSIAVILRQILETPDKTATLVTPDPALARRVRTRLRRWGVELDSSAGEPLEETGVGAFLSHCLRLAGDPTHPLYMASLMANPLACLGDDRGTTWTDWQGFEKTILRGVRRSDIISASDWGVRLISALTPLTTLGDSAKVNLWAQALANVAEHFAEDHEQSGASRLWVGEAGEKASLLLTRLIGQPDRISSQMGDISLEEFTDLFGLLMRGEVVRPRFGTHPQLQILGPMEARLIASDMMILGGLNEGTWPAAPSTDPFLSRAMREELGLSLPERRYGLSAHDFQDLAMGAEVIMTRSKRIDGAPSVASRWLWRLKTLFRGALGEEAISHLATAEPYQDWAKALDHVGAGEVEPAERPKAKPPVSARWPLGDAISVTKVKTFIRDPYAVYAEKILRLKTLEELDQPLSAREYGTALHDAIHDFMPPDLSLPPETLQERLKNMFKAAMEKQGFDELDFVKEDIRLDLLAAVVVQDCFDRYDNNTRYVSGEFEGRMPLPQYGFDLKGTPDRIDEGPSGYEIIDYKTSSSATPKEVAAGFDPQLPLLAMLAEVGAFANPPKGKGYAPIPEGQVSSLIYKKMKGLKTRFETVKITNSKVSVEDHIETTHEILASISKMLKDPEAVFESQIRRKFVNKFGDYDHLARREEWAAVGDSENENNGGRS